MLDLYSRLVVGWAMGSRMTAQPVTDALIIAIWRRGRPEALLHHLDQCSQYASEQVQRLLADQSITCSMSRTGDVWDNSAIIRDGGVFWAGRQSSRGSSAPWVMPGARSGTPVPIRRLEPECGK